MIASRARGPRPAVADLRSVEALETYVALADLEDAFRLAGAPLGVRCKQR